MLSGPVLLCLLGYSLAKRFTSLAHFWLGFALALAPMAAWIAFRGDLGLDPGLARPGRAALGFGVRYHLCLSGRRFRSGPGVAQRTRPAGGPRAPSDVAAGCHAAMVLALIGLGMAYPMGAGLFRRGRSGGPPADLRARDRPTGRSNPGERGVFPGQCGDQHGVTGRRPGGSGDEAMIGPLNFRTPRKRANGSHPLDSSGRRSRSPSADSGR